LSSRVRNRLLRRASNGRVRVACAGRVSLNRSTICSSTGSEDSEDSEELFDHFRYGNLPYHIFSSFLDRSTYYLYNFKNPDF
jgi:hypothetical protein